LFWVVEVERNASDVLLRYEEEGNAESKTYEKPSELGSLARGYEPAAVHEKDMPINIGQSAFAE